MGLLASESLFLHRRAERLVDTRGGNKKQATKQKGSRYLVIDFVSPWTKSTRQRAKLKGRDRPASGTLR